MDDLIVVIAVYLVSGPVTSIQMGEQYLEHPELNMIQSPGPITQINNHLLTPRSAAFGNDTSGLKRELKRKVYAGNFVTKSL